MRSMGFASLYPSYDPCRLTQPVARIERRAIPEQSMDGRGPGFHFVQSGLRKLSRASPVTSCQPPTPRSTLSEQLVIKRANTGSRRKIVRSPLGAVCRTCLVGGVAQAGTNDILIGIDNKITYGPQGQV